MIKRASVTDSTLLKRKNREIAYSILSLSFFGNSDFNSQRCPVTGIPFVVKTIFGREKTHVEFHHMILTNGNSKHKKHFRKNGNAIHPGALLSECNLALKNNEAKLLELMSTIPMSTTGHTELHQTFGKNDISINDYPEILQPASYKYELIYYKVFKLAGYDPTYTWKEFRKGFE